MARRTAPVLALLIALWALWAGCAKDRAMIAIGPPPAKQTTGALAGPLCQGGACQCAANPDDAGLPEGNAKRFEVRLGPSPYELWFKVPGGVLYKSPERPEMCFYVDLPPGTHVVELRASQPHGLSAAVAISELGAKAKTWYSTFRFSCGTPGACSFEELDGKKAEYAQVTKNLHDPCGSTKVRDLIWDTGRSPDQQVPSELGVRLKLQVYKFEPAKPHGDPSCGAGDNKRTDSAEDAESATPTPP